MPNEIRAAIADDAVLLTGLIRAAFATAAERFGLTPQNCPRHPSNCAEHWVAKAMAEGVEYFVLEADGEPAGCAALERAEGGVGYLERLAVLPAQRRLGHGRTLVEHVLGRAADRGMGRVEIALIAEDAELRAWYEGLGFREKDTRAFEHLPFTVLFMFLDL